MRVLFLADGVFQDLPGGARVVARELALGLTRRGHEVTFLTPRLKVGTPDEEHLPEGRVVRYVGAGQGLSFIRAGKAAAARLWAADPYDIVHTHFAYAALGPLASLPRSLPQVRSFYGPWDQEAWTEDQSRAGGSRGLPRLMRGAASRVKRRLRHAVEAASLRRSRAVVVLSEQSRSEVAAFRYPAAGVHLFPGGVDLSRFVPLADKQAVRQALGLPTDRRLLLSVRRLAARMGLDMLIEAIPAVIVRHPDLLLLIGGKGPERARLETLIRQRNLQDHVRLLGFIPDGDLPAYYQAADVFLLPTVALEGFGLVTVEALACGLPVIGTPVGATPEILAPLDPGLIADSATAAALSRSIAAFLDGPRPVHLGVDRLRRYVCENYSWDRHVGAVERLYRDLLASGNART